MVFSPLFSTQCLLFTTSAVLCLHGALNRKQELYFPHQIMHGRNLSIYLFEENYSIQAFYIKPAIISNMFELEWFNSEIWDSNILVNRTDTHIHFWNFEIFAFIKYSTIEWRNIKFIRNGLVRQKGGWHFHYTLTNNKSTKANLVLVNRRQIFLKIVKEYILKYKH